MKKPKTKQAYYNTSKQEKKRKERKGSKVRKEQEKFRNYTSKTPSSLA